MNGHRQITTLSSMPFGLLLVDKRTSSIGALWSNKLAGSYG
jgi:hypothetical protein